MKKTMKYSYYFVLAVVSVLLCACQSAPIAEDTLFADEAQVAELIKDGRLYSLNEFVDSFMTEVGNYHSDTTNYRTRSNNGDDTWLFTVDTLPTYGPGIYIRGRVTTDDYGGNFYKSMVIQQVVEGKQEALRISVDAGSISGLYPRGQEILIRCNGLAIGKYANQVQLCVPSHNNNVWAYNADQKVGWAPGRIPFARFKAATTRIGTPIDAKDLNYQVITLDEIFNSAFSTDVKKARYEDGKLVIITHIHYSGKNGQYWNYDVATDCTTGDPEKDTNANVFAPTTDNIGYPQSRLITDGSAHKLGVSMSEYAKEARYYLPDSIYEGTVIGILSCYIDNAFDLAPTSTNKKEKSRWSISICDLSDLSLKDADGNPWIPQEYNPLTATSATEE